MLKRFMLYQNKCSEIKRERNTVYLSWGGWIIKYVYETTTDTPNKLIKTGQLNHNKKQKTNMNSKIWYIPR